MKLSIITTLAIFLGVTISINAARAEAPMPITQSEVDMILTEGYSAKVQTDPLEIEKFTLKYATPNAHFRMITTMEMEGMPPHNEDKTYTRDELIKLAKLVPFKFLGAPQISYKIASFKYDDVTQKADVVYKTDFKATIIFPPMKDPMYFLTTMHCRELYTRIKTKAVLNSASSCRINQKITPQKAL